MESAGSFGLAVKSLGPVALAAFAISLHRLDQSTIFQKEKR